MRLFLIRHGETVDNIASLCAGSRDSALTNHGVEQTRLLGQWLASNRPRLTHVFASPLQRAFRTACALTSAQKTGDVTVVKVAELVEQDLGYYEGKPYRVRYRAKSGDEVHKDDPGFVDVESEDSLASRSDAFLDDHLLPLFADDTDGSERVVAIVSHGILLSKLWRRLLLRLQPKSVTISPEIVALEGQVVLEHLGGWSNTGFLELSFHRSDAQSATREAEAVALPSIDATAIPEPSSEPQVADVASVDGLPSPESVNRSGVRLPALQSEPIGDVSLPKPEGDTEAIVNPAEKPHIKLLDGYRTTILTINGSHHRTGLKRTLGGIGSAEHDWKQKRMDRFFKRAKKE